MVRSMGLLATAIALLVAPLASAAFEAEEDRRGIEKAEKAGIFIDPAVEHMMATAPAGSCQNDPTAKDCPHVRAFIYAPEMLGIPFSERPEAMSPPAIPGPELAGDAPPEGAIAATWKRYKRARRMRARAVQTLSDQGKAGHGARAHAAQIPPGYACAAKVNWSSPYYAADMAQMDTQNMCRANIYDADLYLLLKKLYKGRWYNMKVSGDTRPSRRSGGTAACARPATATRIASGSARSTPTRSGTACGGPGPTRSSKR